MGITPATLRLREAASRYERDLQRYVCPIYGVRGSAGYPIGFGFLLRLSSATLLITAAHVLHKLTQFGLQIPAGSRTVPIEGDPYASRLHFIGSAEDFGHDVAFVVLHPEQMLAAPSTLALTPADLDLADVPAPRTAYGFAGIPGSENESRAGTFDGKSYFYGGLPAERERYTLLRYQPATHFIMNFEYSQMIDETGAYADVPEPFGMSGGPVFRLGTFDDIEAGVAVPRVIAITGEWWQNFNALVGVRIALVIDAIRQLIPEFASELPAPVHFEAS